MTAALVALSAASAAVSPRLFRIEVRGKFGFVDREGYAVVPPKFLAAGRFREGLAWFTRDGKRFGYLDERGRVAIPARFTFAADFSEGLAAASDKPVRNGFATYGYVGPDGRFRIPQRFEGAERDPGDGPEPLGYAPEPEAGSGGIEAGRFSGGRARVGFKKWIGRDGRPAPAPPRANPRLGPLREGLRSTVEADGILMRYVRPDGRAPSGREFMVPRGFDRRPSARLNYYSEGRAPLWLILTGGRVRFGFVDEKGSIAIAAEFDSVRPFEGGLSEVVRNGRTEYVDRNGKRVWPR
ncbi:MAG: WG repeat-containing protein [Fimbriimonas sp.]